MVHHESEKNCVQDDDHEQDPVGQSLMTSQFGIGSLNLAALLIQIRVITGHGPTKADSLDLNYQPCARMGR